MTFRTPKLKLKCEATNFNVNLLHKLKVLRGKFKHCSILIILGILESVGPREHEKGIAPGI